MGEGSIIESLCVLLRGIRDGDGGGDEPSIVSSTGAIDPKLGLGGMLIDRIHQIDSIVDAPSPVSSIPEEEE